MNDIRFRKARDTKSILTDITPDWNDNIDAPSPYQSVDCVDNVAYKKPAYDRESGDISCAPMPRKRQEEKDGADDGDGGEFRMNGAHGSRDDRGGGGGSGGRSIRRQGVVDEEQVRSVLENILCAFEASCWISLCFVTMDARVSAGTMTFPQFPCLDVHRDQAYVIYLSAQCLTRPTRTRFQNALVACNLLIVTSLRAHRHHKYSLPYSWILYFIFWL